MPEPQWVHVPALRAPDARNLGQTLADIDSHMPSGHPYRARRLITWAHETTHGLNAKIRNQGVSITTMNLPRFNVPVTVPIPNDRRPHPELRMGAVNACYVLNDRAVMLQEPALRLSFIARKTPESLRGMSYRLYLVEQQRYWERQPLYVFDEWSAYVNGLASALDFDGTGGSYSDALQALEFMVYSFVVAMEVAGLRGYDHQALLLFVKWQAERTARYYLSSKSTSLHSPRQEQYLNTLKTSQDCLRLRSFINDTYGYIWLEQIFDGDGPGPDRPDEDDYSIL